MADEVQAAGVFELRAEGGDFRAEIADLTEVAKRFERATVDAFNRAGKAASDTAALEASSKRYVSAIEREALATERKTAALVLSAAEMRRAEAAGRGESANAAAAVARLEEAEKGYASLAAQMQQMRDINVFGEMLSKSAALGQVEKNIDNLTAALNRLQAEAREAGALQLSVARVNEDRSREAADSAAFGMRVAKAQELARAADYVNFWTTALDAADAKEKELADFRAFDMRLAEAAKLNQAADYVQFWGSALDMMEAKERELAAVPLFEKEKAAADKLRRTADATAAFTQLLDELEAKEKKVAGDNAFVEGLQRRANAIGKTQADLLELEAAERGVSQQAAPFIANLRAQERALGIYSTGARDARVSTNQLRTAMQQLPAQFTDVFTSLAGGQNPLLVLIQQGGQIKDSFGGVGNALKALGSILTPVRLLVGGLAAAVGVAGLAYKQASDETDAYRRAVVLSGNAAGTTVGQLQAMAAAVASLGGTQGKAAEVLTQLAGSGKVAAAQFAQLTAAAIALERAGGPAAKDTADAFIELGKAPSTAALKLSESTGFLTAELYKQITALERQGRTSDAAALAQSAAAQATDAQAKKLEAGLGSIQKGWRSVADAAKGAWDAMLNVGRPQTAEEMLGNVSAALGRAAEQTNARRGSAPRTGLAAVYGGQSDLQLQYQGANAAAGYEATNAAYERIRGEANKAGIEIEKLAESLKMPGAVLSDQQKQIKAWGDAWIESAKDPAEAAQRAKEVGELSARAYSMSAQAAINYGNVQARIAAAASRDAQRVASELSDLQHQREMGLRSEYEGIKAIADAQVRASKAEEDRIRQSLANVSQLPAERQQQERIKLEADLAVKRQQTAQITVDANNQIAAAIYKRALAAEAATRAESDLLALEQANGDKAIGDLYKAIAEATQDYAQSLQDAAYAMQIEAAAAVLPEQQREVMLKQLQNELALRKRLREINEAPGLSPDQRDILRSQATQANSAANQLAVDQVAAEHSARLWKGIGEDIRNTLTDAIIDGGEGGAKALQDLFKRLVLRPIIQAGVNQAVGAVGNYAGAAVNAATGSNWFQKAGQAGSTVSGAQAAYNAYGAYAPAANYAAVYSGQAYGTGFATQQSSMLAAQEAGMVSNAGGSASSGWASTAGWVAAIALGVWKANQDWNKGFRRDQAKDVGDELGGGLGTWESDLANFYSKIGFSDKWADALSGALAVSALLGFSSPQIRDSGITGSVKAGDFEGLATANAVQEAGFVRKLFSDDKVTPVSQALPTELGKFLDAGASGILDKAKAYGKALSLPVDSLDSVTQEIKILADKDGKITKDALVEALSGYGDALVKGWEEAIKPLAIFNDVEDRAETTAETLNRVGSALVGVNDVFKTLGLTALQASIDGGAAAVRLQEAFGGLGGLQQAASGYISAIYGESERLDLARAQVNEVLSDLGLAVPTTRAGFRALVDDLVNSGRVATEAGAKQLQALLGVAGAFGQIQDAAETLNNELSDAIGQTLQKLGRDDQYGTIQRNLADAGVSLSLSQLIGASKEDIYEFAKSFIGLSTSSHESKLAVVNAAGALADLRDQADKTASGLDLELLRATGQQQAAVNRERQAEIEALRKLDPALASVKQLIFDATDAAELWSRQLQLLAGVDSIAPDFMAGDALFAYRAERIQQTLAAGGITTGISNILGSTREDVLALWNAVGVDGKEAVLEAYNAWKLLNDEMRAAPIQRQLDELTKKFGDLSFLDPKPLSAVYQENLAELDNLQKGLDNVLGRTAKTLQEALADMLADQKALQDFRSGLADDIFGARLRGMNPADRVAALRGREAQLFGQLGSAKDPVAVAQQLQGVIVDRIKEEADLRRVSHEDQIRALREQINGAERLQRMSEQIAQFTGSMRFSDLSPLGFDQQLEAARSLYETTVAKARGGDETAMGALTGNAQAYLQEARSFFASSEGYAGIFNSVLGELDALGAVDPGLKAAQDQLTALEKIAESQGALSEDVVWASQQEVAALTMIDTALARRETEAQAKIDQQIKLAEDQIKVLGDVITEQKAQLTQAKAIADQLTAELRKISGPAAAAATEASLAGAAP